MSNQPQGWDQQPGQAGGPGQYPAPGNFPGGANYAMPAGMPGQPLGTTNPDDLTLPLYGATFGQAIRRFFKSYVRFTGRASRSEYWWIALFTFLVGLVPGVLAGIGAGATLASTNPVFDSSGDLVSTTAPSAGAASLMLIGYSLSGLISLALLIPGLALIWRRLHDANFAGPMFFLSFIPGVGAIIVFVFTLLPSKVEGMRFDERPVGYAAY